MQLLSWPAMSTERQSDIALRPAKCLLIGVVRRPLSLVVSTDGQITNLLLLAMCFDRQSAIQLWLAMPFDRRFVPVKWRQQRQLAHLYRQKIHDFILTVVGPDVSCNCILSNAIWVMDTLPASPSAYTLDNRPLIEHCGYSISQKVAGSIHCWLNIIRRPSSDRHCWLP